MNNRIPLFAAGAFTTAAVSAALLLPTGATHAAPEQEGDYLPIAALTKPPSLASDAQLRASLKGAAAQLDADPDGLRVAAPGVWVGRGAHGVCIFATNPEGLGGGCWDEATTRQGGAALETRSTRGDGVVSRIGLAPDGYSRAITKDGTGAEIASFPVTGNVYRVTGEGIDTVELRGRTVAPLKSTIDE